MKSLFTLFALMVSMSIATAQELPHFAANDFEGWEYNNPNTPLSKSNIGNGKIVLYVNSDGKALTLTSPSFSCQNIDTINADVEWFTKFFYQSNFHLEKAALTMVIEDLTGQPIDSVTCVPTTTGTSTHFLSLSLAMPQNLSNARLRFVSWEGDVVSNGAVKSVTLTTVTTGGEYPQLYGDLSGNGVLDIDDVTLLIDILLSGNGAGMDIADVDRNGTVSIDDVTFLIDLLLNR